LVVAWRANPIKVVRSFAYDRYDGFAMPLTTKLMAFEKNEPCASAALQGRERTVCRTFCKFASPSLIAKGLATFLQKK